MFNPNGPKFLSVCWDSQVERRFRIGGILASPQPYMTKGRSRVPRSHRGVDPHKGSVKGGKDF